MRARRIAAPSVAPGALLDLQRLVDAGLVPPDTINLLIGLRGIKCRAALKEWSDWRATFAAPNTVHVQALMLRKLVRSLRASRWDVQRLRYEHLDRFINAQDGSSLATR